MYKSSIVKWMQLDRITDVTTFDTSDRMFTLTLFHYIQTHFQLCNVNCKL